MPDPTPHARTHTLKRSTIGTTAASSRAGDLVYCQPEHHDFKRSCGELGELLAIRGLKAVPESYGWFRITRPLVLPQADACAIVACGGRIAYGRCRRCGTKP